MKKITQLVSELLVVILVFGVVDVASERDTPYSLRSSMYPSYQTDPDSYLPEPPIVGLRPPEHSLGAPRNDYPQITSRRGPPQPSRSRSRYRNNFGKGKRMKRPPGPFKVVGKRKVCTYKRKLVKQPYHYNRRSDHRVNPYQTRHPRLQIKRNLLDEKAAKSRPDFVYYKNNSTPRRPIWTSPGRNTNPPSYNNLYRMNSPVNSLGLNLKNYRIFIHQYSDGSEENESPLMQWFQRNVISPQKQRPPPFKRPIYKLDTFNPQLMPAFKQKIQQQTQHPMNRPIYTPNYHQLSNGAKEHNGYLYTTPAAPFIEHPTMHRNGNQRPKTMASSDGVMNAHPQSINSSSPQSIQFINASSVIKVIDGLTAATKRTSMEGQTINRATTIPSTEVGVIYVTPEPYSSNGAETEDWLSHWNHHQRHPKALGGEDIIIGKISPQSSAVAPPNVFDRRSKVETTAEEELNWKPIYPDNLNVKKWFRGAPSGQSQGHINS